MSMDEGDQRRYAPIDIQRLEAENARLQLRGTTFERWFKAAVKHHNDLTVERDEAQGKLRHQEPMIAWHHCFVEWLARYVQEGESNDDLMERLDRILRGTKEGGE